MLARARVALNAYVPDDQKHLRDLAQFEVVEITGEGPDWESAKAACMIPDGSVLLSWTRE